MKFVKYSALLALVAFSLSLVAFGKDKNEGKFTLNDPTQIGSTQLKPGVYKATWEGTGSEVQVKILQGKNVVATASAKVVDSPQGVDSVTLGTAGTTKTLEEIDFGGQHKALVFSSQETAKN